MIATPWSRQPARPVFLRALKNAICFFHVDTDIVDTHSE